MISHETQSDVPRRKPQPTIVIDRIKDALDGLRFGTVTVIVQDGVVVQVERTEKFRVRPR